MTTGDQIWDCECANLLKYTEKRCLPENPCISIRKAVILLENPITCNDYHRQIYIINDFLDGCTYAFWMQDLPYIMRVIEVLNERQTLSCLYRKPLIGLLRLCPISPMLLYISEATEHFVDLQQYFSFFGYLLINSTDCHQQDLILLALHGLLERNVPVGICCVKLADCINAMSTSEFPNILAQLLQIADTELYSKLLQLAKKLAKISNLTCHKMLQQDILDSLLVRLDSSWSTRDTDKPVCKDGVVANFDHSCALLWILLSLEDFPTSIKPPGVEALCSLRFALRAMCSQNRLNRTHLMGIVVQLLHYFPTLQVAKAGLIDDIAILVGLSELGTNEVWATNMIKFEPCELDYQFKQMLLFSIRYFTMFTGTVAFENVMKQRFIMKALLNILNPELTIAWNPHHYFKLVSLSLYILQSLIPVIYVEFGQNNGAHKLLALLDFYNLEPYDIDTLTACVRTIEVLINSSVHKTLPRAEAIRIVTKLGNNMLTKNTLSPSYQTILTHTFSMLSLLCTDNKEVGESVYRLFKKFAQRYLNPKSEDPVPNSTMVISAIDMLWEAVVWNNANLEVFVKEGGVYDLLDIIQNSILSVRIIALSVLVDLCDEGSCISHVITWRGNGFKLQPLLLNIFREDCKRLGVKLDSKGIITDIERPIMGKQQWNETFGSRKHEPNSSPALYDLLLCCRPQVCAILQLVHNRHKDLFHIANAHYKMDTSALNPLDEITLFLAEFFLPLKMGEAWVELMHDLKRARLIPVACDNEVIQFMTERYYTWGLHIKTLQEEVWAISKHNQKSKERLLYHILKEAKLDKALTALYDLQYIARTTLSTFKQSFKDRQREQLDNSLQFTYGDEIYNHKTYMDTLKVANPLFVYGKSMMLQSNKIVEDKYLKNLCLAEVSSDTEDCECKEAEDVLMPY